MRGPHRLEVADVRRLTPESTAVHFSVPDDLAEVFAHEAGQHVTIVREEDGEEVRRSYSICVPARSGELAVGVRHLPGGRFSSFVAEGLRAGDAAREEAGEPDVVAVPGMHAGDAVLLAVLRAVVGRDGVPVAVGLRRP